VQKKIKISVLFSVKSQDRLNPDFVTRAVSRADPTWVYLSDVIAVWLQLNAADITLSLSCIGTAYTVTVGRRHRSYP
jgi:hypothetical protein